MNNSEEELIDSLIKIGDMSEQELDDISNYINEIIELKVEDEKTISYIFDSILNIIFVDDDKKRKVFHKLSNYCRNFNKELADDYDKILEDDLKEDNEETFDNEMDCEKIAWYEEGMKQFTSGVRDNLLSEDDFEHFFMKIKSNINQMPNLNSLTSEELTNNNFYNDLSYLAIRFLKEVMIEEHFNNLKYDLETTKKYGEKVVTDMIDYYTEKFNKKN